MCIGGDHVIDEQRFVCPVCKSNQLTRVGFLTSEIYKCKECGYKSRKKNFLEPEITSSEDANTHAF